MFRRTNQSISSFNRFKWTKNLATTTVVIGNVSNWTKVSFSLQVEGTNSNSKLELRSTTKGVIWFDQVSLMPLDTYNGRVPLVTVDALHQMHILIFFLAVLHVL